MSARVLITGATGFVGRHLAGVAKAAGAHVTGLGRTVPATPGQVDEFQAVDLLDREATGNAVGAVAPERVFHLAALASVARSWEAPKRTLRDNMLTTSHLFEAIREHSPTAGVLIAGSGEEYGPVEPDALPISEQQPLRPQSPYALSKAACDLLGGLYADVHGLRVVRTRAFNHAGPGQTDTYVVSALARRIAEAELASPTGGRALIETGNLAVSRDFTDVRDVARAYWLLLEHAEPGVYNVCSEASITIASILERLANMTDLALEPRVDPGLVRPNEVMDLRGSAARLKAATGWRPDVPFERTLEDTLNWWRNRLRDGEQA